MIAPLSTFLDGPEDCGGPGRQGPRMNSAEASRRAPRRSKRSAPSRFRRLNLMRAVAGSRPPAAENRGSSRCRRQRDAARSRLGWSSDKRRPDGGAVALLPTSLRRCLPRLAPGRRRTGAGRHREGSGRVRSVVWPRPTRCRSGCCLKKRDCRRRPRCRFLKPIRPTSTAGSSMSSRAAGEFTAAGGAGRHRRYEGDAAVHHLFQRDRHRDRLGRESQLLFAGSGQDWSGASFFSGDRIGRPSARQSDRAASGCASSKQGSTRTGWCSNEGHFFRQMGAGRLKIEEVQSCNEPRP